MKDRNTTLKKNKISFSGFGFIHLKVVMHIGHMGSLQ